MSKPMSDKEMREQEKKWRAESDARTLIDAAKVRADTERKKLAMAEIDRMKAELESIKV